MAGTGASGGAAGRPRPRGGMLAQQRAARHEALTPLVVRELEQLEADLGGRQELVGMLALAPLTQDLRYVLGLLGDPLHERKSLAAICAQGNLLPGDLLKHLAAAALLRGKVLASQHVGKGIAAVVADVMERAAPYTAACGTCLGTGTLTPEPTPDQPNPSPGPCETCRGRGQLLYKPLIETQRLAIDMAQLLPKGGGLQILQQQFGGGAGAAGGGEGSLEKLQQVTDRLLYGDGSIDGELLPPAAPTGEIDPAEDSAPAPGAESRAPQDSTPTEGTDQP